MLRFENIIKGQTTLNEHSIFLFMEECLFNTLRAPCQNISQNCCFMEWMVLLQKMLLITEHNR